MDEILLYLSLKYSGQWMDVYASLSKREAIDKKEIFRLTSSLPEDMSFIPMIDNKYPLGYKSIYKPPFGIFTKGDQSLITSNAIKGDAKTVVGNIKSILKNNTKYEGKLLWVNLSPLEVDEVIQTRPENNIFYFTEAKDMELLTFPKGNVGISEIYKKSNKLDYSNQNELRITAGLTKEVELSTGTPNKIIKQYNDYAKNENIIINNLIKSKKK